jgi:hypothetical protein
MPSISINGAGFLAPARSATHGVVSFDRRGHSRSVGPGTCHGLRTQHENDLAGLIEAVGDTVRAILAQAAADLASSS